MPEHWVTSHKDLENFFLFVKGCYVISNLDLENSVVLAHGSTLWDAARSEHCSIDAPVSDVLDSRTGCKREHIVHRL
jgi:hypothetical protein